MEYPYILCDVFTETPFDGNPLAVITAADTMTGQKMQAVAREFGFSESVFIGSPSGDGRWPVRIFTPAAEVPFAGHPSLGAAFVLATQGALGPLGDLREVILSEAAGEVRVTFTRAAKGLTMELRAPEPLSLGDGFDVEDVAGMLSLPAMAVCAATHAPLGASVGLPFLLVELADLTTLAAARVDMEALRALHAEGAPPDVCCYVPQGPDVLRVRVFAPLDGVTEDPATGSAGCALAALLAHLDHRTSGDYAWTITQGVEMGRPSTLFARAVKKQGAVTAVHIGGGAVQWARGTMSL